MFRINQSRNIKVLKLCKFKFSDFKIFHDFLNVNSFIENIFQIINRENIKLFEYIISINSRNVLNLI